MIHESQLNYDFNHSSIESMEFVLRIDKSAWGHWETIVGSIRPPHDPRVLTEQDLDRLDPPAPDSESWVNELLQRAMWLGM